MEQVAIVDIQNLSISLDGDVILDNASLTVPVGAAVGIVGPSGIGKTTFIKALIGALDARWDIDWGHSTMFGAPVPVNEAQWHVIRGKRITYMAQDAAASFVPRRTIVAQLKEICKAISLHWDEGLARINILLKRLDLPAHCIDSYPGELSGGMLQRLALLVALLPKPDLIIADEPTASLDLIRQMQLVELLNDVTRETGCALIFVTHREELLSHLGSRAYKLQDGQLSILNEMAYGELSELESTDAQPNGILLRAANGRGEEAGLPAVAESGETLLLMKNVSITYKQRNGSIRDDGSTTTDSLADEDRLRFSAVKDVSLYVKRGEWVGIIGPSGAGKSTIFKTLCKMLPSYDGQILLNQQELKNISLKSLGQIVQPIFQQPHSAFNPRRTIAWSFGEAVGAAKNKTVLQQQIHRNLEAVNLPVSYGDKYISELSGGEAQRAAIVRSLMGQPELLLCDEITSALDRHNVNDVLQYLLKLKKSASVSGLIITHDLGVAQALCSRVYVMDRGAIVEQGDIQALMEHPQSAIMKELKEAFNYGKAH